MRRHVLPPPRAAVEIASDASIDAAHGSREPLPHVRLAGPAGAKAIPRRFLDPVAGWFRRFERATNHLLTKRVYPKLPGASIPYATILRRHLTLAEAEIPIPGLASSLDGLKILFVSDLHAGPFLSPAASAHALERVAGERPDLIVLGGDFASSGIGELEPHLPAIAALRAPLGVFAVLGNHDHYTREPERVVSRLEASGVRVLVNAARRIERDGATLLLAGIDDWNVGRPDLDRAIGEARALDAAAPIVLLSHNPDALFAAERKGVALVLSGHTHAGQIRIPGLPVLVRMSRYRLDEGRYLAGTTQLVVSRGLGVSGVPLRIACPPEALAVTLRRSP